MAINQLLFVVSLLCSTATYVKNQCQSLEFATPFRGRYCPAEGISRPNLSWHQCKLYCLETSSSEAINYNITDNICTQFSSTCPKAISNSDMAFVLFTDRQPEQCLEWIPKQSGHPVGERSITEDNRRFVARLQKNRNDCVLLRHGDLWLPL